MHPGTTRYARHEGVHLAYQVHGRGPLDLLYVPTWFSAIEHLWEEPSVARFFGRFAAFSRLIMFDRRGSGMSDSPAGAPLEEQMDDVTAVLDAAGSARAGLFAQFEGGPMAMLYAASYPERVGALVLYASWARTVRSDDIPWAMTMPEREALTQEFVEHWGEGVRCDRLAPSRAGDPDFVAWYGKLERLSQSPGQVAGFMRLMGETDMRAILASIRVPTLVLHRTHDPLIDLRHAHYLAERIPGAKLVELPGADSLPIVGDADSVLDEIEEFLTGARPVHEPDRVLATVLFTNIVGSTRRAAELGDARWRALLDAHHRAVRAQLRRHRGREVKTVGDGFLATFDGPARAIRSARDIAADVSRLGLELRAGLHTGELEAIGDDVGGMAVHIGSRVQSLAAPGEVLVSSTVRDLVVGSGIDFEDRGEHELRGVPGAWRLFAVCR